VFEVTVVPSGLETVAVTRKVPGFGEVKDAVETTWEPLGAVAWIEGVDSESSLRYVTSAMVANCAFGIGSEFRKGFAASDIRALSRELTGVVVKPTVTPSIPGVRAADSCA
jgi:hypothetical protein